MTQWVYGCDKIITVNIPTKYSYKQREVHCGSTAYDGGVNQCPDCFRTRHVPLTTEYGDIEHADLHDYDHELDDLKEDIEISTIFEVYYGASTDLETRREHPGGVIRGWAETREQVEAVFIYSWVTEVGITDDFHTNFDIRR